MWTFFHSMRENNSIPRQSGSHALHSANLAHEVSPHGVSCIPAPLSPGDPAPLCANRLRELLDEAGFSAAPVVLCIGTDRLIGDCLGPFLGTLLEKSASDRLNVYGTLSGTVHALNLPETIAQIKKKHPDRAVIAVDASLGAPEHVGSVFVRSGSLRPGAGVRKELPETGDIAITGIVGALGAQPYLNLQTVRLSTIAAMADEICGCILDACL